MLYVLSNSVSSLPWILQIKHSLDNYKPRKTNERSRGTSDDNRRLSDKERKRNNGRRNHQTATKRTVKIRRRSALLCSQRESGISVPMHELTAHRNTISDVIIHEGRNNTCLEVGSVDEFNLSNHA
ncbi:hypothetical protein BDN67DRAFT_351556 [Paxillus ammoniavirescens]|nr:hypothetical protein BDN67DRAFT_351556 [Paxillus ammoniavirescens]